MARTLVIVGKIGPKFGTPVEEIPDKAWVIIPQLQDLRYFRGFDYEYQDAIAAHVNKDTPLG